MPTKNVANMNENGPFTLVSMGNDRNALLVTSNPAGAENSERLSNQMVSGTRASSGDYSVIAAPGAGYQTVIESFNIQNETTTAQTILIKAGAATIWRIRAALDGDGEALTNLRWAMGNNNAVQINLSAAASIGYSFAYHTEPV